MPFSSARSVRAPASNATIAVTARVPGMPNRTSGRRFSSVVVSSCTMRASVASALAALWGTVVLAAAAPSPAAAANGMEVTLADDAVFLYRTYYHRKRAFEQALPLG